MRVDSYYPDFLVDDVRHILLALCEQIEATQPKTLTDLYALTHAATREINYLANAFLTHNSEIETVARDTIGKDFYFIAKTYGYAADCEKLIAPRDW